MSEELKDFLATTMKVHGEIFLDASKNVTKYSMNGAKDKAQNEIKKMEIVDEIIRKECELIDLLR